jgi:histidine decarboxylase
VLEVRQRLDSLNLGPDKKRRLQELLEALDIEAEHFLGYPCTLRFDYSILFPFLKYPINNVGDPYSASSYRLNTHDFEREVIGFFGKVTRAAQDSVWGYVTNGGTEGNMYGIYLARELFPQGMVYYSEDTHYSVAKILRMVNARNIMIKSQPNGEMDYNDLAETIGIHRDIPPIIFANIGTTMKGAVDNLDEIKAVLQKRAITSYYIHADAALSGMILPFVRNSQPFDFSAGIDSISVSGHKMIGSPIPCGIVLAKKTHVERIARAIEYVGTLDTTVTGSRNGLTPLFLWYAINTVGETGFRRIIAQCLEMADYAVTRLNEIGLKAWRHQNSVTVVFPRLAEQVLKKWQIAVHQDIAHLITMPHVRKHHIDAIVDDILAAELGNPENGAAKQCVG